MINQVITIDNKIKFNFFLSTNFLFIQEYDFEMNTTVSYTFHESNFKKDLGIDSYLY